MNKSDSERLSTGLEELGLQENSDLESSDVIVLNKNPLDNISNLRSIAQVYRNGSPVVLKTNKGRRSFWDLYFLEGEHK